jgi:hypothetical protein
MSNVIEKISAISVLEQKGWKENYRSNVDAKIKSLGKTVGAKVKFQGAAWVIFDFDAGTLAEGGDTMVLVKKDLSQFATGVTLCGIGPSTPKKEGSCQT